MRETRSAVGGARDESVLTPQEIRLRAFLRLLAAAFCLGILGYLLPALFGPFQSFFVNLPFVTNSVVKIGGLALLAFFASANVRRNRLLTILLIWGHVISILAMAAVLLWGQTAGAYRVGPWTWTIRGTLVGAMVLDGGIAAALLILFSSADRARYDLAFLWPVEFRCLKALAEVALTGADGEAPVITGDGRGPQRGRVPGPLRGDHEDGSRGSRSSRWRSIRSSPSSRRSRIWTARRGASSSRRASIRTSR